MPLWCEGDCPRSSALPSSSKRRRARRPPKRSLPCFRVGERLMGGDDCHAASPQSCVGMMRRLALGLVANVARAKGCLTPPSSLKTMVSRCGLASHMRVLENMFMMYYLRLSLALRWASLNRSPCSQWHFCGGGHCPLLRGKPCMLP